MSQSLNVIVVLCPPTESTHQGGTQGNKEGSSPRYSTRDHWFRPYVYYRHSSIYAVHVGTHKKTVEAKTEEIEVT